jgi:hypothetical protein
MAPIRRTDYTGKKEEIKTTDWTRIRKRKKIEKIIN